MTKSRDQHVVPHLRGGAVKPAGSDRASSLHDTQREAVHRAHDVARSQKSELFVHGRDGRIRACDSHGKDPYPPKN